MDMSTHTDPANQQPAPRWLLALLGVGGLVLLLGAGLGWFYRGTSIVLDMANFFCL
ncbi:MAG: hypothetical protein K0S54_926 [Alphaproteobacteria bacterium]|jgi:hypothetical protein|nr:hypothetical protein [Alphaproteobacteria bacterium]